MKLKSFFLSLASILFFNPVFAEDFYTDLALVPNNVFFSTTDPIVNQKIRAYATIVNNSNQDLTGYVKFYDEKLKKQLGKNEEISIIAGRSDDVFVDWVIVGYGEHPISIRVVPQLESGDNPSNNKITKNIFVDKDSDGDGIPDRKDPDDDNDGIPDDQDLFPYDSREWADCDGDGIGDSADTDDDDDGVLDTEDAFVCDPTESLDTDSDEIGNNLDQDDDNDGLLDGEEIKTNPLLWDTDGDGLSDKEDLFPNDSKRSLDTDKDGIADFDDTDDDGDGVGDSDDAFPLDPSEAYDTDLDSIGNNKDTDDDNDGWSDTKEKELGTNPLKKDTDSDSYLDPSDYFPLDPSEWLDTDSDGIGDNADTDDDGDGVEDSLDTFPLNPKEWSDCDGDGIGDNEETDDDGDGVEDSQDAFACDPTESKDSDSDGVGDNADPFDYNKAPKVLFEFSPKEIKTKQQVTFSGEGSFDEDGELTSFTWLVEGHTFTGKILNYDFSSPGTYKVQLTIKDNIGEESSYETTVFVEPSGLNYNVFGLILLLLALAVLLLYLRKNHFNKKKIS